MYRILARLGIVIVMTVTIGTAGIAWLRETSGATDVTPPRVTTVDDAVTAPTTTTALPPRTVGDQYGMAYGAEAYQVLDLRLPDPVAFPGLRPVIVYVHSGGWIGGERSAVPDAALAQVARGYAVVSIDYQLATLSADGQPVASFPGAVWDVKRAIRFVKANTGVWYIDPRRVVLMGASAGGHLAAFVGATTGQFEPPELPTTTNPRTDSSVTGVVTLVGPTDMETFERTDHPWAAPLTASFLGCPAPSETNLLTCADDLARRASVATYVDDTDPPIFLGYGAEDTLVVAGTQGEPLSRVWIAAHHGDPASATYDLVQGAGHTLPFEETVAPLTDFFDRVAGRSPAGAGL
jgi:acetyl esterase/lipase